MAARTEKAVQAATGANDVEVARDLKCASSWEGAVDFTDCAAERFRMWCDEPNPNDIDLCGLRLTRFPEEFWDQARGVGFLHLVKCDLKELPTEMGRFGHSLLGIDVSHNFALTTVHGDALVQLTELRVLKLAYTYIVSLPDELFAMTSLRELSLSGCKGLFAPRDGAFPRLGQMTNLTTLSLAGCGIRGELDAAVGNLVNLEVLYLTNNLQLTEIPEDALGKLVNLTTLSVQNCGDLTSIPASIGHLVRLKQLLCSRSGLKSLPPQIGDCVALERVWLKECFLLQRLPPSLSRCVALTHLHIQSTPALRLLPPDMVSRFSYKNPEPVLEYLREFDAGRRTKGAGAGAAGK